METPGGVSGFHQFPKKASEGCPRRRVRATCQRYCLCRRLRGCICQNRQELTRPMAPGTKSNRLEIPIKHYQTDILIVGGGAAGTMAAFECSEAGVAVIQVTKGRATSGTTTVARGGFAAAMGK